jgi:hypothetical protein
MIKRTVKIYMFEVQIWSIKISINTTDKASHKNVFNFFEHFRNLPFSSKAVGQ